MDVLEELILKNVNVNDSFISNICNYFGEILAYMGLTLFSRECAL